jgi:hypothetical protein
MTAVESLHALREARGHGVEVPLDEIELVGSPGELPEPDVGDARRADIMMLVEFILKAPRRLDRQIRESALQPALIPRFLAVSLISFATFGVALSLVLAAAHVTPELTAIDEYLDRSGVSPPLVRFEENAGFSSLWTTGGAWRVIVAYAFGLIAATGVCLPSLYFYGLLSGIRLSMLDVTTHAMKAKATTAVALMGILPLYIAVALGVAIFDWLPDVFRDGTIWLGFMLPFLAGLWGTHSLYRGLGGLTDTLPPDRCEQRGCFLRRLVVSWAACYTAVSPVMIYTVWQALQ